MVVIAMAVTHNWTTEGWLYVAAVLDLFSRRVVGWSMKAERDASLVTDALMMAVWRRGKADALLHHSHQGSQYTSEQLQHLLADNGITCSMSRAGNVWDNSALESFFSSLKTGPAPGFLLQLRLGPPKEGMDDEANKSNRRTGHSALRKGRVMLDRRDRNPYTGAEFPVPAIVNPRMAAFTLPALSTAEARNQHRDMLRRLGAVHDTLWIAELTDSLAERNRRAIWGAMNAPGEDAAISRDSLPLASRTFRIVERV